MEIYGTENASSGKKNVYHPIDLNMHNTIPMDSTYIIKLIYLGLYF